MTELIKTLYKLTDHDGYTRRGINGETRWELGVAKELLMPSDTERIAHEVCDRYPEMDAEAVKLGIRASGYELEAAHATNLKLKAFWQQRAEQTRHCQNDLMERGRRKYVVNLDGEKPGVCSNWIELLSALADYIAIALLALAVALAAHWAWLLIGGR